MVLDIVILSLGNKQFKRTTDYCLWSLLRNRHYDHNIIIVESDKDLREEDYQYEGTTTVYPDPPFHYNKYMNYGARFLKGDYHIFCNNDIEFSKDWDKNLIEGMQRWGIRSASPYCMRNHRSWVRDADGIYRTNHKYSVPTESYSEGYHVHDNIAGWAICMRKDLYEELGGFDEDFPFWAADNSYAEQIMAIKEPHAMINNSIVNHVNIGGVSVGSGVDHNSRGWKNMTTMQVKKYNRKFDKDLLGAGK